MKWVIESSDGSGVSIKYVESPQETPASGGNIECHSFLSPFFYTQYYSFKFLGNGTNPAPTVDNANKSITVTIPANSKTVAFRLDPYECPNSRNPMNSQAPLVNGAFSSANVSIGITATSNNEAFDAISEKLKIEYANLDSCEVEDGHEVCGVVMISTQYSTC